jgi:hypothetical protein
MKTSIIHSAILFGVALLGGSPSASADSADATCEVLKHGDTKQGASGPCTFSQRQGNVDLDLRNGETYSLSPADKPDHFKDQKGHKVVRSRAGGDSQEFKWEGDRKIIVTFARHSAHGSHRSGDTAPDLSDLVGARAGQAEGELERRGYVFTSGSTAGDAKYAAWLHQSSGQCVMIRTEQGRYQSIVDAPRSDCPDPGRHSHSRASAAERAGQGQFDATGKIPCAQHSGQPMGQCEFGVAREGGGNATVVVTRPDGRTRAIFFVNGRASSADSSQADGYGEFSARRESDLNLIRVGDERYEIPDAVVQGG